MKRTLSIILTAFIVVLCLASCSDSMTDRAGTLEISIDTSVSRGMQAISMDTASYNVVVTNSSGEVVLSSYRSTKTSYSVSVPADTYAISVEALNSAGDVIGTGSASAAIIPGQANSVSISVTETAGDGTFSMAITAEAGHEFSYSIKNAAGTTVKSGSLAYDEGVYSATETLANGFYTFSITSDTNKVVKYDAIRIIADKALSYSAEFLFLNDGTITIVNEILRNPVISITLSSRYPKVGDTLTASAAISGIASEYTCYWVLDGVVQGTAGDYEDFEYTILDSDEGDHEIALFVAGGNVIWSESKGFAVSSSRPTELEVSGQVEMWLIGDVLIPWDLEVEWTTNHNSRGTFNMTGHRIMNLGDEPVTLSCSVNYPDYYYYLTSEYDEANDRTVVYIVIDKYIDNPAFIEVDIEKEYQLENNQRFGVWLRSTDTDVESSVESDRRNMGLVTFTNKNVVRTIKVAPDTYRFRNSVNSSNMPNWFYVEFDKSTLTLSADETGSIKITEGETSIAAVQFPDSYEDGTEFCAIINDRGWGDVFKIEDGIINVKYRPDQTPTSLIIYTLEDKDCYYTVTLNSSTVTATRHEAAFADAGITIPSGEYAITYTSDCLIPRSMRIQLRVGDSYSYYDAVPWDGYDYCTSEGGPLEIFAVCAEDYHISATVQETTLFGETINLVTVSISAAYDEYSILNISYDFDLDLDFTQRTAVSLRKEYSSEYYYLPVIDKSINEIKAVPGRYWSSGSWNSIATDAGRVYPNISPEEFNANANDTVNVSITMEL